MEGGDARGVGQPKFVAVQVFSVEGEGLTEVFGGPKEGAAGTDLVSGVECGIGLLDQSQPDADHAWHQLSRSPAVICAAIARHSPTLAIPESALPTLR